MEEDCMLKIQLNVHMLATYVQSVQNSPTCTA